VAVPRTSVEPPRTEVREPRQGLSLQTLLVAALASGIAAIVVSQFWESGTIFASAMTPVCVAILSELLRKPVESERLRSGVRSVSSAARPPSFSRPRSGRTPRVMAPPAPGVDEGLRQREEGVEAGPVRVYSSGTNKRPRALDDDAGSPSPRRRLHLKVAVITGLIAFLIAAAALTLPELLFGSSVSGGGRNTTYFGGGSETKDKGESQDGNSDNQSDEPTQQDSGSGDDGQDQPSQDSGGDEPETTTPETTPDSQDPAPAPTPAPAPQTPTPQAPAP
jgi:hypothetical protein